MDKADSCVERLLDEMLETQKRRHRLDVLKIVLVTVLLGFGGLKTTGQPAFVAALYLAPLVAVFFDLLITGEHFSIGRIGAFLRIYQGDPAQQQWQKFVSQHRGRFFILGSVAFMLLTYVGAIALLLSVNHPLRWHDAAWFGVLLLIFVMVRIQSCGVLGKLDKDIEKQSANP